AMVFVFQYAAPQRGKTALKASARLFSFVTIGVFVLVSIHGAYGQDADPRWLYYWELRAHSGTDRPERPLPASPGTISANDLSVPAGARSAFEKGRRLLLDKGKTEEATAAFQRAVAKAPLFWQAHFLLGLAYVSEKQWRDAEEALRKAV